MTDEEKILVILQEECAEVIQAISKCFRFGFLAYHPDTPEKDNRLHLAEELGDISAMVHLLIERGIVSEEEINQFKEKKFQKLKRWSGL